MSATARRILVLDGHPDPDPGRFVHALAEAYAGAASEAGHEVVRQEIARLDFPLLRDPADWLGGKPSKDIARLQADIEWADHLVLLYPLWLGDVPALLKGVLEQALRPGFALEYREKGLPRKLLAGRSARIVVTMGMPALFYRWVYSAHSLRSLERNILKFVGFAPVEHTLFGGIDNAGNRAKALEDMLAMGARGA